MDLYELYKNKKNEWDNEKKDPTKSYNAVESLNYLNNQTYKKNNGDYSNYYSNRW